MNCFIIVFILISISSSFKKFKAVPVCYLTFNHKSKFDARDEKTEV